MKRLSLYILQVALPVLAISTMFPAESAAADSIIHLIGDKTAKTPNDPIEPTAVEPPSSSVRGSTTIRIIGDKSSSAQTPVSQQASRPELNEPPSPIKEIRIIGDKTETVQKKAPEQPVSTEVAKKEPKEKTTAEEESLSKEAAEKQMVQRLETIKAEEQRKAAEKAERERLEQLKAEQENQPARQAAIQQEQERLAKEKSEKEKAEAESARQADIKREEERLAARKAAEKERIAALKAEEERLAAAQRALVEKRRQEVDTPARQPASVTFTSDLPAPSINGLDSGNSDNTPGVAPETIWDLYLSAKVNDPALGRTEARATGSKADSDLLLSGLMPHVDSRAGVQQISQKLTNYGPNDANSNYTALDYNVTARITLLNIPTIYSLSAATAGLNVELAGVAAARQNLIVKFTDSYFSLLKAQTDKQIAQSEINRLKQVLEQSQAFLRAGTGDIIAVYEAQSRVDGARADLSKSESSLRLAEQKLSTVVGKPVTSIVNYLPQQPIGPDPDNLDWWVATMEKEQPLIRQAREGVTQTSEQRKAAKSEYLPVLQASGGYDVNRGTAALPTAEVRQWFAGATISMPLYSGGELSAKVRRAVASEEERRHIFDETMDQQRENVKQAFFNLRYNISLIRAQEQRKVSAEIQLEAVSKGRKIGTRNAIDVLNAEQAYSMALRDYKYALYDNIIRVIQLKSAAGILEDADVSEVSKSVAPMLSSRLRLTPSGSFR